MLFVRVDELRVGMRLGKPIYNKNGVLLYDRDSKLTMQAIYGIRNFGLMGLYILEPAEPLPPMSEDDINFERFQTMAIFSIREDLDLIAEGKKDKGLDWLCSLIMKNYVGLDNKINFVQSLRSAEDFVYKHSLNVAILSTIIASQLDLPGGKINAIVKAAILHDLGRLKFPSKLDEEMNREALELIRRTTMDVLGRQSDLSEDVLSMIMFLHDGMMKESEGQVSDAVKGNLGANILFVADAYDRMTAMKSFEEPTSEVKAIRALMEKPDLYDEKVVRALVDGINILYPGVCVQLTNHESGLVITENKENIFEPFVLSFRDNKLYNLADRKVREDFTIADVMKTMDNRIKIDPEILEEYQKI